MADQSLHPDKAASGQALKRRILSGLVMVFMALSLTYAGGWPFVILVAIAVSLMLYEWNAISGSTGFTPAFWLQNLFAWSALAALALGQGRLGAALIAAGIPVVMLIGRRFGGGLPWAPLGLVYAAVPALAILWLRQLLTAGFEVTIWVLAIVWATDIGGYVVGRWLGGPKLARSISPNKTWAGLSGGMAFAAATSVFLGYLSGFVMPWLHLGLLGAGLAVWAQVGDLAESALKRHFGVKDSGAIIPGHGGILDRLDGFVFVAPVVAFLLWWLGSSILVGG